MGTASTTKPLKNVSGAITEFATLTTSAGAGDANALPALNASGILDDTIINASATSSADKVVKMTAAGIIAPTILNATITSAGSGDSAKLLQLDSSGRIDSSAMPIGIGADTSTIIASEAIASGDFVNIWNSTGAKCRKADATTIGKHAMGFVLVGVGAGAGATVYFEGTNTAVSGQTPGDVFLATVAGTATSTAPSSSGNVVQAIGIATSATSINFQYSRSITLV
jgi:hypothetical protein